MNSVRDYIQIVLELLVMVGVMMYIIGDVKVSIFGHHHDSFYLCLQSKKIHVFPVQDAFVNRSVVGSWAGYFGNFWSA